MARTKGKTASQKHLAFFQAHYATMTCSDIAGALGISVSTVHLIAKVHGLRKSPEFVAETHRKIQRSQSVWTEALADLLTLMRPVMTTRQQAELLGMSLDAVRRTAGRLGLDRSPKPVMPRKAGATPTPLKPPKAVKSAAHRPGRQEAAPPKLPPPMTPAQLARRDKERIRLTDYKTIPHINGTMRALYRGTELHHRGMSA